MTAGPRTAEGAELADWLRFAQERLDGVPHPNIVRRIEDAAYDLGARHARAIEDAAFAQGVAAARAAVEGLVLSKTGVHVGWLDGVSDARTAMRQALAALDSTDRP